MNTTMLKHRLSPMFEAKSIVIVGASPKENSFGMRLVKVQKDFKGQLDVVNSRHKEILGKPCKNHISELDYEPDLVILGVGSSRIEQALLDAIDVGAKSCIIYDDCYDELAEDDELLNRLKLIAKESNMPVCGGNCMGFFNITDQRFGSYYPANNLKAGGISLIAHSGSVFTVLAMSDERYRFDIVVSPGQEIGAYVDDYIEYALTRSTTKVIALFLESARRPKAFLSVLNKARIKKIPVVVCKVGATVESSKMAQSHTGAMAGSFTAYVVAMESCGAIVVDTVDQLMNTALLCSQGRFPGQGKLATVTDSGGLREVAIDRAQSLNSPLLKLTPFLEQKLKKVLPPSLLPSNPLDCLFELSEGYEKVFEESLKVFSNSDDVAIIGLECDFQDSFIYAEELLDLAKRLPQITDKPCFLYSSFSQAQNKKLALEFSELNIPFLNGLDEVLHAVTLFLKWRDNRLFLEIDDPSIQLDAKKIDYWKAQLKQQKFNESKSLNLFSDLGMKTTKHISCNQLDEVLKQSKTLTFPLVLKTAEDINHKSDVEGVFINIENEEKLGETYHKLKEKLGNKVLLQEMITDGVELSFGAVVDPDFGTIIMVSAGGILIEILKDRVFAVAPFGKLKAEALLYKLVVNQLLDGVRGKKAVNKKDLIDSLALFSSIAYSLQNQIAEIDINPIIVTEKSAISVDALLVQK